MSLHMAGKNLVGDYNRTSQKDPHNWNWGAHSTKEQDRWVYLLSYKILMNRVLEHVRLSSVGSQIEPRMHWFTWPWILGTETCTIYQRRELWDDEWLPRSMPHYMSNADSAYLYGSCAASERTIVVPEGRLPQNFASKIRRLRATPYIIRLINSMENNYITPFATFTFS